MGDDPLWYPTASKPRLYPEMFQRKTQVRTGLFLEELPGHPVIAIGHAVEYDPTRKLWFCDIELDEQDTYYTGVALKENLDASRVMQVSIQRPVDPARLDDDLLWHTVGPDTVLEATAAKGHRVDTSGN